MRLGIIGRGPWGNVYAETLRRMDVEFWQAGMDWQHQATPDGVIVVSAPDSHYRVAFDLIEEAVPILLEKPVCTNSKSARHLLGKANLHEAIVFTGHTRLYSPSWREFKAKVLGGVKSFYAAAGSRDCKLSPLWDWGPHLVSMCLDLGFAPSEATIATSDEDHPLTVIVNGEHVYAEPKVDTPQPLEVLLTEFMAAIEKGEPDIRGLELGVKVVEAIEGIELRQRAAA